MKYDPLWSFWSFMTKVSSSGWDDRIMMSVKSFPVTRELAARKVAVSRPPTNYPVCGSWCIRVRFPCLLPAPHSVQLLKKRPGLEFLFTVENKFVCERIDIGITSLSMVTLYYIVVYIIYLCWYCHHLRWHRHRQLSPHHPGCCRHRFCFSETTSSCSPSSISFERSQTMWKLKMIKNQVNTSRRKSP